MQRRDLTSQNISNFFRYRYFRGLHPATWRAWGVPSYPQLSLRRKIESVLAASQISKTKGFFLTKTFWPLIPDSPDQTLVKKQYFTERSNFLRAAVFLNKYDYIFSEYCLPLLFELPAGRRRSGWDFSIRRHPRPLHQEGMSRNPDAGYLKLW